jgi:hypothetical protein
MRNVVSRVKTFLQPLKNTNDSRRCVQRVAAAARSLAEPIPPSRVCTRVMYVFVLKSSNFECSDGFAPVHARKNKSPGQNNKQRTRQQSGVKFHLAALFLTQLLPGTH